MHNTACTNEGIFSSGPALEELVELACDSCGAKKKPSPAHNKHVPKVIEKVCLYSRTHVFEEQQQTAVLVKTILIVLLPRA